MHGFTYYITMVFSMCPRWLLDRWIRDKNLIRLTGVFLFLLKLPPDKVAQRIDGTCIPCISTAFVFNLDLTRLNLFFFGGPRKWKKGHIARDLTHDCHHGSRALPHPIPGCIYLGKHVGGGGVMPRFTYKLQWFLACLGAPNNWIPH